MKNANKRFTATNIRINCRFSYCHVFQPRKNEQSGKMKYDCCLIVSKDDTQAVQLINEAIEGAKALYKEKFGAPKGRLKTVVHDGDEDRPDDPVFANALYINASSERKPGVKMLEAGMLFLTISDVPQQQDFVPGNAAASAEGDERVQIAVAAVLKCLPVPVESAAA